MKPFEPSYRPPHTHASRTRYSVEVSRLHAVSPRPLIYVFLKNEIADMAIQPLEHVALGIKQRRRGLFPPCKYKSQRTFLSPAHTTLLALIESTLMLHSPDTGQ